MEFFRNLLGNLRDIRAIPRLTKIALESDSRAMGTRKRAASALVSIGDKRVLDEFLSELRTWTHGPVVTIVLIGLRWKPHSDSQRIHFLIASRNGKELNKSWDITRRVLLEDIESYDRRVIENSLYAAIGLGRKTIIPQLIEVLNARGTKIQAVAYLNSGHSDLELAARIWAREHGYRVSESGGRSPVRWGEFKQ